MKKPGAKAVMGRPSSFKSEQAFEICTRIFLGETIRQICESPDMPDRRTVYRWLEANEDFRHQYARAREESAHVAADGVTEIGKMVIDGEIPPDAARVAIDALKWAAGKRKPKVYGDRIVQEHTGADGGPIQTEVVNARDALALRIAGVVARIGADGAPPKPH